MLLDFLNEVSTEASTPASTPLTSRSICKTPPPIGLFKTNRTRSKNCAVGAIEENYCDEFQIYDDEYQIDAEEYHEEILYDGADGDMSADAFVEALDADIFAEREFQRKLSQIVETADTAISVVPADAVSTTVPELMDQKVPAIDHLESQINELRAPVTKRRRKKVETPASLKDDKYLARRKKNNDAASMNRARAREERVAAKERAVKSKARHSELVGMVNRLEDELERLLEKKAWQEAQVVPDVDVSFDFFSGLSPTQFSVTPPMIAV